MGEKSTLVDFFSIECRKVNCTLASTLASVYFTFRKCVIFFYPTLSKSKLYTCLYKPQFYRHNKRTFLSIFLVAEYSRRRKKTLVYTGCKREEFASLLQSLCNRDANSSRLHPVAKPLYYAVGVVVCLREFNN